MRLILAIALVAIIIRLCTWDSRPYSRRLWFGPYWYTPMPRWPRGPMDPGNFRRGPGPGSFGGHDPSGFGGGGHGFGGGGRR
ncbi:MAG: hypothetical protein K6C09_07905 [Oscillospiraceae bacterium]|jgi:uncharacterized membrane protein YgcG|nr:hypothetical protein [Oscillospiraceae bacterium]